MAVLIYQPVAGRAEALPELPGKGLVNARALVFALVAFGGVALVLFSAPANGDASLLGNVFGVLAMFLWTAYVVSTRHFRQTWTWPPSWRRSARSRRWPSSRWRSPRAASSA